MNKWMGYVRGLFRPKAEREVMRNVMADVHQVMAEEGSFEPNPDGPTFQEPSDLIPYHMHDREGQYGSLKEMIDWDDYLARGLPPDQPRQIMIDAVDRERDRGIEFDCY